MTSRAAVIFMQDTGWRVGLGGGSNGVELIDLIVEPNAPLAQVAQQVGRVLDEHGGRRSGAVLALPSQACLCALISLEGLPKKDLAQAMLYRLEEKLPLAAEDVVAQFVSLENEAFGVCTSRDSLSAVVQALGAAGIEINGICPAALLALQHLLASSGPCDVCVWRQEGKSELFLLREGKPVGWYQMGGEFRDFALHLGLHRPPEGRRQEQLTVCTVGVPPEFLDQAQQVPGLKVRELPQSSILRDAASFAQLLSGKKGRAWIDLARGGIGLGGTMHRVQRPLRAAAVAAAVFLLVLSAGMFVRGWQYREIARQHLQAQHEVFRNTFPSQAIPIDVTSRLASEERKLRVLNGGGAADAPPRASALVILRDTLSHLPAKVRVRLSELRLAEDGVSLKGEARSHADAEALAAALQAGGFAVTLPKTEQVGMMGVNFTMSGSLPAGPGTAPGAASPAPERPQ